MQQMTDIAKRCEANPIIKPEDITPSNDKLEVTCILNPGAFIYKNKTHLLMRVAERPVQKNNTVTLAVIENEKMKILEFNKNDPLLNAQDPRTIFYKNKFYLTTISHLMMVSSDDGMHFDLDNCKRITSKIQLENYGIEDCRVTQINEKYYLTYTAVSENGFSVAMTNTANWTDFAPRTIIIPGPNKDCALFKEKINGQFICLHRPCMGNMGGENIWMAKSPDLIHWGQNQCIAKTRKGKWDCKRIGAGATPIKTKHGWLVIYHGADDENRYCLGAMLLDCKNPAKILARSEKPIMQPIMQYEKNGFFANVIFTNGHVVNNDTVTIYYGASDTVICKADMSINEIIENIHKK